MKTPRKDVVEKLISQARADPGFFRELVFDPEKVLSRLDYLDRSEKGALLAVDPDKLLSGLLGAAVGLPGGGTVQACGGSCGNSCSGTCSGSCGGTCSSSCRATCGATSCNGTTKLQFADYVTNPAVDRTSLVDQIIGEIEQVVRGGEVR